MSQKQKLPSTINNSPAVSTSSRDIAIKTHESIQRLEALKVTVLEKAQKQLDLSLYIIRSWIS